MFYRSKFIQYKFIKTIYKENKNMGFDLIKHIVNEKNNEIKAL